MLEKAALLSAAVTGQASVANTARTLELVLGNKIDTLSHVEKVCCFFLTPSAWPAQMMAHGLVPLIDTRTFFFSIIAHVDAKICEESTSDGR